MQKNKNGVFYFLVIVLIISCIGFYRSCEVQNKGIYSIATVYEVDGARGGIKIKYKYNYKDKEYQSYAIDSKYTFSYINKRLFIKFLKEDPNNCLITDQFVPDSITEAPAEGWKEIPISSD